MNGDGGLRLGEFLWFGPVRRPARRVLRGPLARRDTIALGPLRGLRFPAGAPVHKLGAYEPPTQRTLASLLHPGGVFWDIGANWGYLSLLGAACVGHDGHVLAVEPLPANLAVLDATVAANGLSERTEVLAAAVCDTIGTTTLYSQPGEALTPSVNSGSAARTDEVTVPTVTLDSLLADRRPPDVVKVDVEGAELLVLEGAATVLEQVHPTWLVEVHDAELHTSAEKRFATAGYDVTLLGATHARRPYPCHLLAR